MPTYHKKSSSLGAPFARKLPYEYDGVKYDADLKDGDIVVIMDSGVVETGQFGEQNNFTIKTRNGEKRLSFNQSTINALVEDFGEEGNGWIGKRVKVILRKDVINKKKVIIPYLTPPGWLLDEYGDLIKEAKEPKTAPGAVYQKKGGNVPPPAKTTEAVNVASGEGIDYPEETIDPDDIPF